jgi:hypothetical protein
MSAGDAEPRLVGWFADLEARHLADLTFPEVSRALRALSSCYVERRGRIGSGGALDGAGKRAAFALFYGPLHFLLVRHVVSSLGARLGAGASIADLGCGTGVAGAAWALACDGGPELKGIDRNPWAVGEAAWTWRVLGLRGRASVGDVTRWKPHGRGGIVAAFAVNEWPADVRTEMRERLRAAVAGGRALLVVEPLAGGIAPWWREWSETFAPLGGVVHEWRLRTDLPSIVSRLDRAVGLDHREITGRSIYVPAAAPRAVG